MRPTLARFVIGAAIGLAAGMIYGWILNPVEYVDTTPGSLREDYRTDYILMVAEAYAGDGNLDLARVRLAALGPEPPAETVVRAIEFGVENEFARLDLETLNLLAISLRTASPTAEITSP
ncbi:MAG TPA: hypothetical protein VJJ46_03235 [Anaerolineales bacterium]|nr:hypothetical protein [Anaerolineales bacterium]